MKRLLLLAAFLASLAPAFAQGIPATANLTAQDSGACTTANACLTLNIAPNMASSVIQLSGTWSGTVQFEASTTQSTGFSAILGTAVGSTSTATSSTTSGAWRFNVASVNYIRVRVSAYSSGTIVAAITASNASSAQGSGSGSGSCATVGGDLSGSCASAEVIGIETQPWPTIAGQTGYLGVTAGVPVILSSAGLTNPMTTLCDTIYGGTAGAPTRLPCPTTPSGVTQEYVSNPSINGGVEFWTPSGIANNTRTSAYTFASADCNNRLVLSGTSNVAVSLPTPTTLAVSQCASRVANYTTGASTTVTITPAGGFTIGPFAAATYTIPQNQWIGLTVDGTNWDVDSSPGIQDPIYPVLAYGATFNNSTDDTVAIQSAVNAACALNSLGVAGNTGGTVLFPGGGAKVSPQGQNPDGSTYDILIPCRGITFLGPSTNLYNTILNDTSSPSVFNTIIQDGTPKEATITSISRSGNLVTANFATMSPAFVATSGSGGPNTIVVVNVTGGSTSFDGTFALSTASPTSATWTQTGANESGTVSSSSYVYSSADNANEYDGIGPHFADINVDTYCTGTQNANLQNGSGSYVNHTAGVWDWRGGYGVYDNARIGNNCQFGWGGVQSQLTRIGAVSPERNSIGIYAGPRSDNTAITKEWDQYNDTGIYQNGVADFNLSAINGASCGPSTYWLFISTTGPASGPPALGSSIAWRRPNTGTNLYGNWTESESTYACPASIGFGVGDSGTYGNFDLNIYGHTIQNFAPPEANFIDIGNADHIHIYGIGGFLNQLTNAVFNQTTGTCVATDIVMMGESSQQAFNLLKNAGCTGTAPVAYWQRYYQGQWQLWASNATTSQVITQLGPTFADFDGFTSMHVAANAAAGSSASWDLENAGVKAWSLILNTNGHGQFQDSANSFFSRFDFTPGGQSIFNSLGTGAFIFNSNGNAGTGGYQFYSGGATPTLSEFMTAAGMIEGKALGQISAGEYAKLVTLSGGAGTFNFPAAYNNVPICTATGTANPATLPTITTSAATVAGTGTDTVNVICVGNPN
jgi:hypothetical protein